MHHYREIVNTQVYLYRFIGDAHIAKRLIEVLQRYGGYTEGISLVEVFGCRVYRRENYDILIDVHSLPQYVKNFINSVRGTCITDKNVVILSHLEMEQLINYEHMYDGGIDA